MKLKKKYLIKKRIKRTRVNLANPQNLQAEL
jgi:hypothetical protein